MERKERSRERGDALEHIAPVLRRRGIAVLMDVCTIAPEVEREAQWLGFADVVGPVLEVRLDKYKNFNSNAGIHHSSGVVWLVVLLPNPSQTRFSVCLRVCLRSVQ
jgi:hypothetical protein